MKPQECYHFLLAQKLMEEWEKRNMEGFFYESKEDALKKVLELIPEGSTVSCGGVADAP